MNDKPFAVLPPEVEAHCNKFKLCRGCKLNCVAPVSDRDFPRWILQQIEKIKSYEK